MAELNFPPSDQAADQRPVAYEFGPQTLPYFTDNGLTYTYEPDKDSWVLKTGVAVTQDDLQLQMLTKLSVTGGSILGTGNALSFTETQTSNTPDRIVLSVDGQVTFNSNAKNIVFNDLNDSPARICGFSGSSTKIPAGGGDDEDKFVELANRGIVSYKTLYFANTSPSTLIAHSQSPRDNIVVMDLNSSGDYEGKNQVVMPIKNGLEFVFNNHALLDLDTDANGRVKIRPTGNNSKTFRVTQSDNVVDVLRVDVDSHKIFTSEDYNEALISGAEGAFVSGSDFKQQYTEDNLVATIGFVKEGFFKPGMNVFATTEQECEVGGMWTDGFNYYIRVEE